MSQLLSEQQLAILQQLSLGHSQAQTRINLGITRHTLQSQLREIGYALGSRNTLHAVAKALRRHLII